MANEMHTLVASSNSGRFALDEENGPDISAGQPLDIFLNGIWIPGRVEHAPELYSNRGIHYPGEKPPEPRLLEGYYFLTSAGMCGLCAGMKVRIP